MAYKITILKSVLLMFICRSNSTSACVWFFISLLHSIHIVRVTVFNDSLTVVELSLSNYVIEPKIEIVAFFQLFKYLYINELINCLKPWFTK